MAWTRPPLRVPVSTRPSTGWILLAPESLVDGPGRSHYRPSMGERPAYRRRSDGILEIRRSRSQAQELLRAAAVALGGIGVVITLAVAMGWRAGDTNQHRTSGRISICWNWSAGVPTGCWTR